ncbi:MAG: radical SAM protein [Ruminiclostridium sp.]|nr:radical SAM protein [Ruminiclostridium sp.]
MNPNNIITYDYFGSLYINMTNRCDCRCVFCIRDQEASALGGLWLDGEPTRQDVLDSILAMDPTAYPEIVFCGYGEPTCRLDDMLWLCDRLHEELGDTCPPIRLNTNGHGSLINHRDVTPELAGRLDAVSVSLNGSNLEEYLRLTRPGAGEKAWQAMLDFVRDAGKYVPKVMVSIVDYDKSQAEIDACRQLAESLGAIFRVRPFA